MIIVGSKALKYHFPNFPRSSRDIDVIGYESDVNYLKDILKPESIVQYEYTTVLKNIQNKTDVFHDLIRFLFDADA